MVESSSNFSELKNEDNFKLDGKYSSTRYLERGKTLLKSSEKLDVTHFALFLMDMSRPFKSLSSAMSKMSERALEHINGLKECLFNFDIKVDTIDDLIAFEVENKLHECDGDNNKKKGFPKESKYHKYSSFTIRLNKLKKMVEFNMLSYENFIKGMNPDKALSSAFEVALEKLLSWMSRKLFSAALSFVSSKREEFYKAVAETSESNDTSNGLIKELHSNLENLHKSISNILTKNKADLIIEF